jgi:hypothetical protein
MRARISWLCQKEELTHLEQNECGRLMFPERKDVFFEVAVRYTASKNTRIQKVCHQSPRLYSLVSVMDHLHYRLNFDQDKSRQKFHHSLKEHHKISNIPKFRCEML